ncbi:ABATE domain-containing protein [Actinomadura rupiterrae]|uniref:ABATE domain-containing protein n=1 Tax=Actinomadura rupiterrae TaxID=559627 RepID=UPI0020A5688A|nr:ABATE domain-containing protein [Actinomadura rupiterrae]MCP2336696.1 putative RNA-binding Zn ribbon-like protein [Actinomadura rupiterrae]
MDDPLALRLASTIRATRAGLTDAFATPEGLTAWVRDQDLSPYLDASRFTADEPVRAEIAELRQAVRALFARAVAPSPLSSADAPNLPPFPEALARVNAAAAPLVRTLEWHDTWQEDARPTVDGDAARLAAALANAAVDFFAGPLPALVQVCPAPRCVLYFIKRHPQQEWCSTRCGNRARAARHYRRQT